VEKTVKRESKMCSASREGRSFGFCGKSGSMYLKRVVMRASRVAIVSRRAGMEVLVSSRADEATSSASRSGSVLMSSSGE